MLNISQETHYPYQGLQDRHASGLSLLPFLPTFEKTDSLLGLANLVLALV
jgi:hypothetical protein